MRPARVWSVALAGAALAAGVLVSQPQAQTGIDLIVEATDAVAVTSDRQTLVVGGSLRATLRNLGRGSAGSFTTRAFEDRNGNGRFDVGVDALFGSVSSPGLAGLTATTVDLPLAGTQQFSGNLIHVEVDAAGAVAERDETNNIRHTGQSSVFAVVGDDLAPVVLWQRESFTQQPASRRVRSTPAVGDLDGDGMPEIAFNAGSYLRVLDGRDGAERLTVVDPTLRVNIDAGVSLADLDDDGRPEILTFDLSCRAIVFEHDGTLRWRAAEIGHGSCWNAVAVADLDADGEPEVIAGHHVYDRDGQWLWTASAGRGGSFGSMPVVADIDLDGALEVVMGNSAYEADGTVVYDRRSSYGEGYPAVGNLDDDPEAEIVFKLRVPAVMVVLEHDGTTKWTRTWTTSSGNAIAGGGAPTIADFDGDGRADIGVSGTTEYRVYDAEGTVIWSQPIYDTSSGVTSSTVFDVDNDGSAEVIFADEEYLYVWNGPDGAERIRIPRGSTTGAEGPIVADVDADGHADIVVGRDGEAQTTGIVTYGIAVYTGAARNWANTRRVWNQPAYSITHVRDDLSIPTTFTPNWRVEGLNNFRLNTFDPRTGTAPDAAPNFTASWLRADDRDFPGRTWLTVRVGNGGATQAARTAVSIAVDDEAVCGASTSRPLAPGEFEDVSCAWISPAAGTRRVVATVDPAGAIAEGDEDDNDTGTLLLIGVGPESTVDALTVRTRDGGAELRWQSVPGAVAYNVYRKTDGGAYALVRAALPASTSSHIDSGLSNNTVHWYQVRAVQDGGGESAIGTEASGTPIPRTQRGDTAPTITSVPVTRARTGQPYAYAVSASDPDRGDVLTFALVSGPTGLAIDAQGRLSWLPGEMQGGPSRVHVAVSDPRGRTTSQVYTLFVETQVVNTTPVITSAPIVTGTAGRAYAYRVVASDPDAGDVLTFVLEAGPVGMSVHHASGLLSWMPGPDQVSTHGVRVSVRDLAGATATQMFDLRTTNPNRPPAITSTAPEVGQVGVTVGYAATATDPDAGDVLTWTLPQAPDGATVDAATGLVRFTPVASGPVAFTLEVADLLGAVARQSFTVEVRSVVNGAPTFTTTAPTQAEIAVPWGYTPRAADPDGDTVRYALVTGPAGMGISGDGVVTWLPGPSAVGDHTITIRASDVHGAATDQTFVVTVAPVDSDAPVVAFVSPEAEAEVEGDVAIVGTASDANLVSWSLDYQVAGDDRWTRLAAGDSSVEGGTLATLPAGLLANRPYILQLQARDRRQGSSVRRRVVVGGSAMKIGAFRLTYTDVEIPAGGYPIRLERHYDSTRPYLRDFGPGWALGFSTIDLRVDGNYHARLTLPSGREARFQFAPESLGFAGVAINRYVAGPGIADRLENLDCPQVLGGSGAVVCLSGTTPIGAYVPRRWRLTTADGTAYTIEDARVTRIDDRNGRWISISSGGITSSSGHVVQIVRNGAGAVTQVVDAGGHRVQYGYDAGGRLASVVDQAGQTTTYGYEGDSHLVQAIEGDACQGLRQEFGPDGRLTARVDAAGARTTYAYDLTTDTIVTTYPTGASTRETFGVHGQPTRFVDGEGHVTTHTYDAADQRVLTVLPSGRRLTRTYDAAGNPLTASSGRDGGTTLTTAYVWTPEHLLERVVYPTGEAETFAYDPRGNLTRRRALSATATVVREHTFTYDDTGRLASEQTDRGIFSYAYDLQGNLTRITDGAGRTSHIVPDAFGRPVTVFTPEGHPVGITYDAYGLPTSYLAGAEVLYEQSWNAFRLPASTTDGSGARTTFTNDCSGTLSTVDDRMGGRTTYLRDPFGLVLERTDPLGRTSRQAYDRNGRLVSTVDAAGGTIARTWSPDGREASRTSGLGTVSVTFDDHGRPAVQTEPTRSLQFTYDGRGRVTRIVTTGAQAGTHVTEYDAAGAVTAVTDRFGYRVSYTYDLLGRRISMTSPDGLVTTYTHDAGGQVSRIATGTAWADLSWDAAGRRTSVAFSNGVRSDRTFDPAGRLETLVWRGPSGAVLRSWAYQYDSAGRAIGATLDDGHVAWTHDALGRLTSEQIASAIGGSRSGAWTYDAAGNRLDAGTTFGDDHRLLTTADRSYPMPYDAAGNATRAGASASGYALGFDVHNRLVSTPFGAWRYNAVGQRDETTVGTARRYVYDGENVLAQATTTSVPHRYTHGPFVDDLLFAHNAGAVRFYVVDAQGSVVALTDESGAVVRRHAYDAWGVAYHSSAAATQGFGGANHNPFLYQGREWQTFVELYDFRARTYDPRLGRFLQKDPDPGTEWLPASRHPYQFAFNAPTRFVDPLGESAIQYNVLLTKNPLARLGGAMAGLSASFTGTTLSYLGHFLDNHLADPSGDLSGKSQAALSDAKSDMAAVLKRFERYGHGSSVGKGIANGIFVGKHAAALWIGYNVP